MKFQVKDPQELFEQAIARAVEPLREKLALAIRQDDAAYAAAQTCHPDVARDEANQLIDRASRGDAEALATLDACGGHAGLIAKRAALFPVREAVRKHTAMGNEELLTELADRLVAELQAAGREIQTQWEAIAAYHGEGPSLSVWDARCRNLCNSLANMPGQASVGVGASWMLTSAGLRDFIIK